MALNAKIRSKDKTRKELEVKRSEVRKDRKRELIKDKVVIITADCLINSADRPDIIYQKSPCHSESRTTVNKKTCHLKSH